MIAFAIVVGLFAWGAIIWFFLSDPVMRDSLRRRKR